MVGVDNDLKGEFWLF